MEAEPISQRRLQTNDTSSIVANGNRLRNFHYCDNDAGHGDKVRSRSTANGGNQTSASAENFKKKTKKWSLSGLFKKRRDKSSDTDSSSETEGKKTGFLSRNSRRRNRGSRKVVGKFETIILPKHVDSSSTLIQNGGDNGAVGGICRTNDLQLYDASPNVIKRERNRIGIANGGSGGSLDAASRRNEKSKVKARVEAMRDRLRDESSSSDECPSSTRNSNGSLTRTTADVMQMESVGGGTGTGSGSWSRRSRAARTDRCRYSKRHRAFNEATTTTSPMPISNPDLRDVSPTNRSRWFAKVVYQQSNDYPMRYTARTHSATSSPMSSPLTMPKNHFQSRSLPLRNCSTATVTANTVAYRNEEPLSPPPDRRRIGPPSYSPPPPAPPPRNPNRKTLLSAVDSQANRPSSYAFDANARQAEISSFILADSGGIHRPIGYATEPSNRLDDRLVRYKSHSEAELRGQRRNLASSSDRLTGAKKRDRYSMNTTTPSPLRSNVYINRNLYADEKPNVSPSSDHCLRNRRDFGFAEDDDRLRQRPSLQKANELGIPLVAAPSMAGGSNFTEHNSAVETTATTPEPISPDRCVRRRYRSASADRRPLSAVSEKSDNDVLAEKAIDTSSKPRNLEEALVELEEIYNSLKLSDEDLLDRADRRDLQATLKQHWNHNRRRGSDETDNSDSDVDAAAAAFEAAVNKPARLRLPTSRRSAIPDAVADDMAYRKLNKKNRVNVKSNPNVVSQSGSFLLMSPTLSPPPLPLHRSQPPPPSLTPLGSKEPDITLDDVVFRSIRHVNNTLKVSDPQPPFGIPLGLVSPAPNSDYLHAVPSEKYRSTFNPSRMPDVVKDDLAYRNLRKDFLAESYREPVASKKRRAIRSLSANVVSLIGQRDRTSHPVDSASNLGAANEVPLGSDVVFSNDRSCSFGDLSDKRNGQQRWGRRWGCERDNDDAADVDDTLDSVADETLALSRALRVKLRELESMPQSSNRLDKDVFAKRVAVHKPITLSAFKLNDDGYNDLDDNSEEKNAKNESVQHPANRSHGRPRQLKLVKRLENVDATAVVNEPTNTDRGNNVEAAAGDSVNQCPDFNWNSIRVVNVQQPKRAQLSGPPNALPGADDFKFDKMENSSSGVSSTSNTPDSARKCQISNDEASRRVFDRQGDDDDDDDDDDVLPSFENASRQFSQELNNVFHRNADERAVVTATEPKLTSPVAPSTSTRSKGSEAEASAPASAPSKKDFCSRIEITLSTPQPAGADRTFKRWSSIETKDAAIMTEEFGLNGRIGCENRSKSTNGNGQTALSRANRYKEERRKQLARQFHNLSHNFSDTSSLSSSSTVDDGLKKTSFPPLNSNSKSDCNSSTIKDHEARKPKISNNNENLNKIRRRQSQDHSPADLKLKSNGSTTSDSTATSSSKSCRDKSSKRKSYLNRSTNIEKTSTNYHNNRHSNYSLSDDGSEKKWPANATSVSSLPRRVVATTSSPPVSSHYAVPSPSYSVKPSTLLDNSQISSYSARNGFAQYNETDETINIADSADLLSNKTDKSKIPKRIHPLSIPSSRPAHSPSRTRTNFDCDDTCLEFRLKQVETITLDDETRVSGLHYSSDICSPKEYHPNNGYASFSEYEMRDHSIEEDVVVAPCTTANNEPESSVSTQVADRDVSRHEKNTLLQIVQNFSGKYNAQNSNTANADNSQRNLVKYQLAEASTDTETVACSPSSSPHNSSLEIIDEDSSAKPSILKKKLDERSYSLDLTRPSSILKRKTCGDANFNHFLDGGCSTGYNVKQGILKKHSSLDEQEVRRRSCSPDVDIAHQPECKPILKSQRRRSSLEGLIRNGSPELHSILKRTKMATNEDDNYEPSNGDSVGGGGSSSPHGILKRKQFAGCGTVASASPGSANGLPDLSSTLAATAAPKDCRSDDMTPTPSAKPTPILKNKQHSFELAIVAENWNADSPRPILKKKASVETDTDDEKPVKPILKSTHRRSVGQDDSSFLIRAEKLVSEGEKSTAPVAAAITSLSQNLTIKPILKKRSSLLKASRNVKSDDDASKRAYDKLQQNFVKRHSLPISSKQLSGYFANGAENGLSVAERIHNLENLRIDDKLFETDSATAKNSASRNLRFSRNIERYKTQPITYQELFSTGSAMDEKIGVGGAVRETDASVSVAANFDDRRANKQREPVEQQERSFEDDKAVISSLKRSNSVSSKASLFSKWQNHTTRANEPAVKLKKNEKLAGTRKLKIKCSDLASRFSTQPVTSEEVAEAKKHNQNARSCEVRDSIRQEILQNVPENDEDKDDPSLMSLSERVKLFSQKMDQPKVSCPRSKRTLPKKLGITRFNTQPVTSEELHKAKIATYRRNNDYFLNANRVLNDSITKGADEAAPNEACTPNTSTDTSTSWSTKKKTSPLSEDLFNVSASFEKLQVDYLLAESPSPQDVTISNLVDADVSLNNDIDQLFDKIYLENSSETGSQSEGDTSSSGGREIQRIVGGVGNEISTGSQQSSYAEKRDAGITGRNTNMNIASILSADTGAGVTDVVDDCPVINGSSSIAQRLAALQRSGQLDWKKRISRVVAEEEMPPIVGINETQELLKKELTNGLRSNKPPSNATPTATATATAIETKASQDDDKKDGSLAERLEKLENASQTWKKRVEPKDAAKFSVAGKMGSPSSSSLVTSPLMDRKKRTPCPSRFRSFREKDAVRSTPISPEKSKSTSSVLIRSLSLPSDTNDSDEANANENEATDQRRREDNVVTVPQIFDQDFCTFFGNVDSFDTTTNTDEFASHWNDIKMDKPRLTSGHRRVRVSRKHATSGNPLKTLATRVEIKNEYRETKTNVAEKELKRMNVEKLSKSSNLAVEVLAGLASKEDFSAVQLRKAAATISAPLLSYKPLMLLHVKGRRHVQTRLVEPAPQSVNSGDCYVLVTAKEIYLWIGELCNVIEKSRGAEIAQHILATHDLGCSFASKVHTIAEDQTKYFDSKATRNFWSLLGVTAADAASIKAIPSGHPDEDEIYENSLISTNMVFEVVDNELVPYEKYWASIPKIQMLDPNKVLVFDFGSEMYIWMGKNVDLKMRKSSVKLAEELWQNGYNYDECDLCPITSVRTIGHRSAVHTDGVVSKKGDKRPEWCLLAKVTQHMETVLFREKFLDWPDFSRVIRAKGKDEDTEKQIDGSLDIKPCDAEKMLSIKITEPDLVLEGCHLGRGIQYFDEERRKFCMVTTSNVKMWHITEFESEEMAEESLGQFYSTDSYVVRWIYSISYTGRELSGQPSKHTIMGRDRCVYFCWQGKNASLNEQGAAALLTVELDKEKGVQLRIGQGYEPPAFFNLFAGRAVIYRDRIRKKWKLFVCKGEIDSEACLLEVSCNIKQLRSRASLALLNVETGILYIWHGCKVTKAASQACLSIANSLKNKCPPELGVANNTIVDIIQVEEGKEPKEFFSGVGSNSAKLYLSLLQDEREYESTPLLYNLSSNSGVFCATPIWSPCRHVELTTAYPFLQEDLYSASQPALFLLDAGHELWLWQGWWPELENVLQEECARGSEEVAQNSDNFRGSATVRWQLERRAAMQTALDYWKLKYSPKPVKAFLVWAGLEPIQFTNLFPDWNDRDDVAEMNIMDGRKPGEVLDVEQELARLTQSTYPIEQLLQRPLPDGVDPTKLELYLSPQHFEDIMKVTKEEFLTLPSWKQTNMKKNAGLF